MKRMGTGVRPATRSWKGAWYGLQALIAVTLLATLISRAGPDHIWQQLRRVNLAWAALCFASVMLAIYFRVLSLIIISRPFAHLEQRSLFSITLISAFFSNFLPGQTGGDLVKGVYLTRPFHSTARAYAAIVMQRVMGLAGTLVACGAIATYMGSRTHRILLVPGLLAGFAGFALLLLPLFWTVTIAAFRKLMPDTLTQLVPGRNHMAKFASSIEAYRQFPGVLIVSLLVSILTTFQGAVTFYFAARAVGLGGTWIQSIIAGAFAQLSALLPVTPGGAGVTEQAIVASCIFLKLDATRSAGAALLLRLCIMLMALIGGVIFLLRPVGHYREATEAN